MLRLTSYLIGFLCVWSLTVLAHAQPTQDPPEYKSTMRAAARAYGAGNYLEARDLFQHAHEIQPNARTLHGLGLAEHKLNHRAAAVRFLSAAIDDVRKKLPPKFEREAEQLIQEMRAYLGSYRIVVSPVEATFTVDGSSVDAKEQPLLLELGEYRLSVGSPGYQSQDRQLKVRGGETEELRFDLVREPPAVPPVIATVPPVRQAPPPARRALPSVTPQPEPALFARRTTWGWIALGASALSLTGTIVAWRISESAADRWNDDDRCLQNGDTRAENCGADEDTAKTARAWATAGLIATGVFGAAGATLLLWPGQERSDRSAQRMQCVVAGMGLACAVRL